MIGGAAAIVRAGERAKTLQEAALAHITEDINDMKSEMKEFRNAIRDISNQKVQIDFLLQSYNELRHDQGFIVRRRSVDNAEGQ